MAGETPARIMVRPNEAAPAIIYKEGDEVIIDGEPFEDAVDEASACAVVNSAAETVQATAAQSGVVFRLSHAAPTLVLPNTDQCIAGSTQFFVVFTGDTLPNGTVDAGSALIDYTDIGAGGDSGAGNQATPCHTYQLFHILYLGSNIWASTLTIP